MSVVGHRANFTFPSLSAREILICLQSLGIKVGEEDLRTPSPDFVKTIYERFVLVLLGVARTDVDQLAFGALSQTGYPELHIDAVNELRWLNSLSRLVWDCGVADFDPCRDLAFPEKARTSQILSALINFSRFHEMKAKDLGDAAKKMREVGDRLVQARAEVQTQEHMIAQLRDARRAHQPEIDGLNESIAALDVELFQMNADNERRKAEWQELKRSIHALEQTAKEEQFVLYTLGQECEKLRSQIIESPEQEKAEIRKLLQTVEAEERRVKLADAELDGVKDTVEHSKKLHLAIDAVLDILTLCTQEVKKNKQGKARIEQISRSVAETERMIREGENEILILRKKSHALSEKQLKFKKQFDVFRITFGSKLDEAKRQKSEIESEILTLQAETRQVEGNIEDVQRKQQRVRALHRQVMDAAQGDLSLLRSSIRIQNDALIGALRSFEVTDE